MTSTRRPPSGRESFRKLGSNARDREVASPPVLRGGRGKELGVPKPWVSGEPSGGGRVARPHGSC